jgi:4-aminobutyrate aminotransferase
MIAVAKGIASGMPLSVLITRAGLMDWAPGSHASTFGGNPVAIAAALATLDVLEREGMRNAEVVGGYMMDRMRGWPRRHQLVGDVRGLGLMIGVEIVLDQEAKTLAGPERDRIIELAFERGVLLLGAGPSTIRICPPLVVSHEQADAALDILEECIGICERECEAKAGPGRPAGA